MKLLFFVQKGLVGSWLDVIILPSMILWLSDKVMRSFVLFIFVFLLAGNVEAHPGHGQFEAFQKDMNEKRMEIEKISSNCTSPFDVCSQIKANHTQFTLYLGDAKTAWKKYEISASFEDNRAFDQLHEKLNMLYENTSKIAVYSKE